MIQSELSANVVAFCRYLRNEGMSVGLSEEVDALRALDLIQIGNFDEFRLALRIILAHSRKEQESFDRIFDTYWYGKIASDSTHLPMRKKPSFQKPKQSLLNPLLGNWSDAIEKQEGGFSAYSPVEILRRKDFANFTEEDFKQTIEAAAQLKKVLNAQRGLRYQKSLRHQLIDFRRTLRLSLRNAGEVLDLAYKERSKRPLKLLLLCDVSGSMENYSKFLISFIYSLHFVYSSIETFVFSTSLTRLTGIMNRKTMNEVLQEISDSVPDWSGGTRIGESFQNLLEVHPDKISKNTVVMILSDGWDIGNIELLKESMKTIHRKSKRVIWLNPLLSVPEYEPESAGMQCALPYIDDFLAIYDLESLRNLCIYLASLNFSRRKTA
jgi:uncharacterized protein with von Willebrand factor type A (vWA) domain